MQNQENSKSFNNGFAVRWANWVIKHPWRVLGLSLLLVAAIGSGLPKLGFDGDYRVFFSEDNPQLKAFDELQNKYTQDDNVLIVIEPKDGAAFSASSLAAIEQLTEGSWQTPYSSRVDAVTNFQHTYAQGDDLYVENLVEQAASKSDGELQKIQRIALEEPLLVHRLVNEEGTITAVNITVKLPGEAVTEGPEVVAFVRAMTQQFEADNPNLKTHLSELLTSKISAVPLTITSPTPTNSSSSSSTSKSFCPIIFPTPLSSSFSMSGMVIKKSSWSNGPLTQGSKSICNSSFTTRVSINESMF